MSRRSRKEIAAMESASGMMATFWIVLQNAIDALGGDIGCVHRLCTPEGAGVMQSIAEIIVLDGAEGATKSNLTPEQISHIRQSIAARYAMVSDPPPVCDDVMNAVERHIRDHPAGSLVTKDLLVHMLHQTRSGTCAVVVTLPIHNPKFSERLFKEVCGMNNGEKGGVCLSAHIAGIHRFPFYVTTNNQPHVVVQFESGIFAIDSHPIELNLDEIMASEGAR